MKVYIGGDHGGFEYKERLKTWLTEQGYQVEDLGAFQLDPADDYPQFAFAVAEKVVAQPDSRGILFCRSSGGVTMAANKVKGARAFSPSDQSHIQHVVNNDHANIITLAGDWLSYDQIQQFAKTFLETPFGTEERHVRRVEAIKAYESQH